MTESRDQKFGTDLFLELLVIAILVVGFGLLSYLAFEGFQRFGLFPYALMGFFLALGFVSSLAYFIFRISRRIRELTVTEEGVSAARMLQSLIVSTRVALLWGFSLLYVYSIGAGWFSPSRKVIVLAAGAVLLLSGALIRSWALLYRPTRHHLIVEGPYRIMRHPRYFGTTLELIGLTVMVEPQYFIAPAAVLSIVAQWVRAYQEESELYDNFGEDAALYRDAVPMIPVKRSLSVHLTRDVKPITRTAEDSLAIKRELANTWVLATTIFVLILWTLYSPK